MYQAAWWRRLVASVIDAAGSPLEGMHSQVLKATATVELTKQAIGCLIILAKPPAEEEEEVFLGGGGGLAMAHGDFPMPCRCTLNV